MLKQQTQKIRRSVQIVRILVKYGFEDLAQRSGLSEASQAQNVGTAGANNTEDLFERIRKVLEELGGTFVKFGQSFSAREDLLPAGLVMELKKLQDQVPAEDLPIRSILEEQLSMSLDEIFSEIEEKPFASASISQVYKATLLTGEPVILKLKRPGIRERVETDLSILKDLVNVLTYYSQTLRKINLEQVLSAFANAILAELSFLNEQRNITRFNQNFESNPSIYLAKVYPAFSSDDILCMDFVPGAKITDLETLRSWQLDLDLLVKNGLNLYLTQVIDHGFFHADPHAGNLMVLPSGQIAFIDMGSMGTLIPPDKEVLEDFVVNFMQKDARRLRITIEKMALICRIEQPLELERELEEVFYLLDSNSLEHVDVKDFFTRFSAILNKNEILMPEHIYLLVRGIALIEGIGRALSPDLKIMDEIKPFVYKTMMKRLQPEFILKKVLQEMRDFQDIAQVLPRDLASVVKKLNAGELQIQYTMSPSPAYKILFQKGTRLVLLAVVFFTTWITGALFLVFGQFIWTYYLGVMSFGLGLACLIWIIYEIIFGKRSVH